MIKLYIEQCNLRISALDPISVSRDGIIFVMIVTSEYLVRRSYSRYCSAVEWSILTFLNRASVMWIRISSIQNLDQGLCLWVASPSASNLALDPSTSRERREDTVEQHSVARADRTRHDSFSQGSCVQGQSLMDLPQRIARGHPSSLGISTWTICLESALGVLAECSVRVMSLNVPPFSRNNE